MTMPESNNSTIGVDFIGVLFAVVIGVSATELTNKDWFAPGPSATFQPIFLFHILTLVLGYITVIYSWIGYQSMIRDYPHKLETTSGFFTFIVDILLLACYLLILVRFESFWFVLLILTVVYWLYVLWDVLHWLQYSPSDLTERSAKILERLGLSRLWAIVFTLLFGLYWWLGFGDDGLAVEDYIFLFLAYLFTILYREHHKRPVMKPVLNVLTLQWVQNLRLRGGSSGPEREAAATEAKVES